MRNNLLTIKEASIWISSELERNITPSNISYLVNYGRIKKYSDNGNTLVNKDELLAYYRTYYGKRQLNWTEKLGNDINWHLSFEQYKESETTKHVHRLHPYKGKFIPQLVEYFLDQHIDEFKTGVFFNKGDIILDPFCGSGTTLVQANELGMHAVGIDISAFNALISNVKIEKYDLSNLYLELKNITEALRQYKAESIILEFEQNLNEELTKFNNAYFPSPEYKRKVRKGEINEEIYGKEKEEAFNKIYKNLLNKYKIEVRQERTNTFLDVWYTKSVREEIDFVFNLIKNIRNKRTKKLATVILSRTIRSCRATTHSDLATLVSPVYSTYYCSKHGKICKPLFSILSWWERYTKDTLNRIAEFNSLRTDTFQHCFTGDSRTIDIFDAVDKLDPDFGQKLKRQKFAGIFSSPPYVGLINYHEQHEYAYELFGFERNDSLEIGPLFKGKGQKAKESYIEGIASVLINSKKYLANNFSIFLVANDKYNLYPVIANKSGLKIVQQFKRPVLNRTEKDKGAYSESIFLLKENS
ncbi:DNA methylase N-4/N-6 domain protein [Melioribacter roseus P3M-2]|uniref:DNA methylase N-4/N-6 domain protein n=1 Tax=Melioribacter roseus (strain DSM 23840 / JCM 17771 / VKM B-2668 / P3M-2) TaxID=1191523 RepID=I7A4F5_MELRP|nr:DNA methyltransferase [Melioribacter roseus]AFN74786.1 DNA methylase N-4/N-6 domain protein [Melioribacter roseus P3M-2]